MLYSHFYREQISYLSEQFDLIPKRLKSLDLELLLANLDVTINKTCCKSL